jgi:hypothetical protein
MRAAIVKVVLGRVVVPGGTAIKSVACPLAIMSIEDVGGSLGFKYGLKKSWIGLFSRTGLGLEG